MAEDTHAFCRLAIEAQDKFIAEQVDKLRELRAECMKLVTEQLPMDPSWAVVRLDAILNNVTGVEEEMPPG